MEHWPSGSGGGFLNQESLGLKLLDGFKFNSAFHPSKIDEVSARNSWGISG